jgi:hypothetical protein
MQIIDKHKSNAIKKALFLCSLLLLITIQSCSLLKGGVQFDYEKFKTEKRLWGNAFISNYSYQYYSSGFTFEDVQVEVKDNFVISSTPLNNSMLSEYNKTINDIYSDIEKQYLLAKDKISPDWEMYLASINVIYDSNHIPASVSYGYNIPAGLCVDGNFGFSIINFIKK